MSETANRAESIFAAVVALSSPAERASYLGEVCAGDPALRARLESLLRAHERADHLLVQPAANGPERTAAFTPSAAIGTVIDGRYKLLEAIGEGGMGTVFMAEQTEPVRRLVAVKLIRPGLDSQTVLARFEAERQALALMDHPNIAKVFDAGATADGRPFFVMELVKGTPITKFCDDRKLTPRQRLELFVPVCQAIQHAHQKGVIHRDIKPTNVLVALYDGYPVPKVIDFGIAKAAGQPLTERTLHTGFGAILGTPEYMSPEQATFNQLDIDTRSDVYALGVLLYELLTGTTPVDKARLKEAAVLEVLRIVREEEPSRPSVKLTTADTRASIAATRGTEPAKLSKLLRGELDWIVMKALEKDRNRRYDTAAGLAKDVQRYLGDEIVEARPPSAAYRLRRSVRRNRGVVVAGTFIFLALVVGIVGSTWGLLRAEEAERDMIKIAEFAEDHLVEAVLQRGKALLAEEAARHNAIEEKAARERAERSEKAAKVAAGQVQKILEFFQFTVLSAGVPDPPWLETPHMDITVKQAIIGAELQVGETFADQPMVEATVRHIMGVSFLSAGENRRAVKQFERALALRRVELGAAAPETMEVLSQLAVACLAAGDRPRAIKLFEESLVLLRVKSGSSSPETITTMEKLAELYNDSRRPQDAVPLWQELVAVHRAGNPYMKAVEAARENLLPQERAVLESSAITRAGLKESLLGLGDCLNRAGRPVDAEPILRESLARYEKEAPSHVLRFLAASELGGNLLGQRKYPEAEGLLLKAYGPLAQPAPRSDPRYAREATERLVRLYDETGQPAKAAEWRKKSLPTSHHGQPGG